MGTVWVEFHFWRGVRIERDLFGTLIRLGFMGLGISRHHLIEWINQWHLILKSIEDRP